MFHETRAPAMAAHNDPVASHPYITPLRADTQEVLSFIRAHHAPVDGAGSTPAVQPHLKDYTIDNYDQDLSQTPLHCKLLSTLLPD